MRLATECYDHAISLFEEWPSLADEQYNFTKVVHLGLLLFQPLYNIKIPTHLNAWVANIGN